MSPRTPRAALLGVVLVIAGCTGRVSGEPTEDEPRGGPDTPAPVPGGFVGPSSQGGGAGTDVPIVPGPTALRRLTNDEYRNTMADLLGSPPDAPLQVETRASGYDNFSSVVTVSTTLAAQYEEIARQKAANADVARLAPCAGGDEQTCAGDFIKSFGKRAFRRPLTSDEHASYLGIYTLGRTGASYADGIKAALEALLASPHLLYRFELGRPATGGKRVLDAYEIASELSYLLTGTMPDAELLAAADANRLTTPTDVSPHVRRLLTSPKAKPIVRKFVLQWFGLPDLQTTNKDSASFPTFGPELRAAMTGESERFIDDVLWGNDPSLGRLLTSPETFVNDALAGLYGANAPGSKELVKRTLDRTQRAGLLTHASVLATTSHRGDSYPIGRGKFVRKSLLCLPLPPPPPSVMVEVPPPQPGLTTRDRFAQHSSNPACASCHSLIDPLGFGLENYDAIGAYRTTEGGRPIDATGEVKETGDVDGPYTGGVELAAKLGASKTTAACAVIQATRWAYGRLETESDRVLAASLADTLGGGRMSLVDMIGKLTLTESFFVRTEAP